MKINYSFLKDELAIAEIRKHKWIESQKSGREIGFASAAIDWVAKYGNDWLVSRLEQAGTDNMFSEKRSYRRIDARIPLQITTSQEKFFSHTKDFNLMGLSCLSLQKPKPDSKVTVVIDFKNRALDKRGKPFVFQSRVQRVSAVKSVDNHIYYKMFLPFTENVRNFLRVNAEALYA